MDCQIHASWAQKKTLSRKTGVYRSPFCAIDKTLSCGMRFRLVQMTHRGKMEARIEQLQAKSAEETTNPFG